jgi:hypothetical protein
MPVSYRIDAPHLLVVCTATGVVTLAELEAYHKKLNADAAFNFKEAARVLWDFTGTTHFDHSAAKYVQVAESWLVSAKNRRALVAASKGEVRNFLSLWVLHRTARRDPHVKLFDSVEKARLGLDEAV